jgi:hypothetical protein
MKTWMPYLYLLVQGVVLTLFPSCVKACFKFKQKPISLDGSLISRSIKVFPRADYNCKKAVFKLHIVEIVVREQFPLILETIVL